jgi:hypothetical protein
MTRLETVSAIESLYVFTARNFMTRLVGVSGGAGVDEAASEL